MTTVAARVERRAHIAAEGINALHKASRATLVTLLTTDTLTGAMTRDAGLAGIRKGDIVAMVDVDNFKHVNDTMGHRAGDIALATLAERLGTVGKAIRLGGDEFVVVIHSGVTGDGLREAAEGPTDDDEVDIRVSIGFAYCGSAGVSVALHTADLDMLRDKRERKAAR